MKIIIVDDEITSLQSFLSEIINNNNIEYRFFKDEIDSIKSYVKSNDITCAFLDINMPGLNGIVLASELIKINNDIKILFVTGLDVTQSSLPQSITSNVLGFIYKPYTYNDVAKYINIITNIKPQLVCKMFNSFECFINGNVVMFTSNKSKELFALLLTYNGRSLSMSDAISQLWPDRDIDKAKILYRDAVWRLRKTLDEYNIHNVSFQRGLLMLDKSNISCDYWDYLNGTNDNVKGIFLKSYDWAIDYLNSVNSDV